MKCWEGGTCSRGSVGGSRKTPRLQISAVICCCVRNTAYKIIILFLFPCFVPCCNPLKNDTRCDESDRLNTCSKERPVLFSTALQIVFTYINCRCNHVCPTAETLHDVVQGNNCSFGLGLWESELPLILLLGMS